MTDILIIVGGMAVTVFTAIVIVEYSAGKTRRMIRRTLR